MAAPVPPRGRGGGPAGEPAPTLPPPPPPPGPVGPAGPLGPPGPPPAGAALLAQMVAAMQAAAAGLPAPGPGLAPPYLLLFLRVFQERDQKLTSSELMTGWILVIYYQSTNLLILSIPLTTWLESGMIH